MPPCAIDCKNFRHEVLPGQSRANNVYNYSEMGMACNNGHSLAALFVKSSLIVNKPSGGGHAFTQLTEDFISAIGE